MLCRLRTEAAFHLRRAQESPPIEVPYALLQHNGVEERMANNIGL